MVRALGHACGEWGTSEYEARCDLRALAAHAGTALLVRAPHARRWVGKRARFEGASVPVLSIADESTIVPLASTGRQSRGASWRTRDMALRPTASLLLVARLTASRGLSSETAVSGEVFYSPTASTSFRWRREVHRVGLKPNFERSSRVWSRPWRPLKAHGVSSVSPLTGGARPRACGIFRAELHGSGAPSDRCHTNL